MAIPFIPLLRLATPYVLGSLEFLRSQLFPSVPTTTTQSEPYIPPFSGGQCAGTAYIVGAQFRFGDGSLGGGAFGIVRIGAIQGTQKINGNWYVVAADGIGGSYGNFDQFEPDPTLEIVSLVRQDGLADNCGNLPNPDGNDAPPISDDGIADSAPPSLDNDALKIVEGAPLVTLPNFGAALLAALNAARQAANALDAIKSIADAIELLKDLLDKINEDTEDKDKDGKKDIYRYQFGSIRKDGFLRLYPNVESNSYKAEQLDINLLSIPLYYGRYFGEKSPNFYRFKSLGYIAFVSATFGIIEYRQIEFSRMSLKVPDDCIGFFYHLGLENDIVANVWGYYTQPQLIE